MCGSAPAGGEDEEPAPAEEDEDDEAGKCKEKCIATLEFWEEHKDDKQVNTSLTP